MSELMAVEDFQHRVLAELSAVKAENERLAAEMGELRAGRGPAGASDEKGARISRGQFLRLGAAAAAAGAVGAGGALLGAGPAGAAVGTMQFGTGNDAVNAATTLTSALGGTTLLVNNTGAGGGARGAGGSYGLWGQGVTQSGVIGRYGTTGADPAVAGASGVLGVASDNIVGVRGVCDGSNAYGVHGVAVAGFGVRGYSETGVSLAATGGGRIWQLARGTAGAPTTGSFFVGEQIRDVNGELWLCTAGGTPGTWRRAATVREGYTGGSVNLLARPIRIYDSRVTGGILANGATRNVAVTGVVVGGVSVPAGAKGVLGNITVVSTGAGGYLTLFPQGSPPTPVTASINWFAANQVLNTAALVRLNPANGQMGVGNGLDSGSTSTHFVFDASGFVF